MKPILNKLEVSNFDRRWGPKGQFVDWVTRSTYISDKSLTLDEFKKIIEDDHNMYGNITFSKHKLTYSSGTILYKHIVEEVMY